MPSDASPRQWAKNQLGLAGILMSDVLSIVFFISRIDRLTRFCQHRQVKPHCPSMRSAGDFVTLTYRHIADML